MSRRPKTTVARVSAIALSAVAGCLLVRSFTRRAPRPEPPELRDALNDEEIGDLASRHAALAGQSKPACALCHVRGLGGVLRQGAWASASDAVPIRDIGEPAVPLAAPPSSVCLSCHDGSIGHGDGPDGPSGRNHPIGADYRAVQASAPGDYNPLDERGTVRLEDGKVGCVSCHRLHARPGRDGVSRAGVVHDSCVACHRR